MFSTSYDNNHKRLISFFIKVLKPKSVLEIGTQQGSSAIVIAKAMSKDSYFRTCDFFLPKYSNPPYADTHADLKQATINLEGADLQCQWDIFHGNYKEAMSVQPWCNKIDVLHIDICNHYDNLAPILNDIASQIKMLIILEGGIHNKWQKKYRYQSYIRWLEDNKDIYSWVTIPSDDNHRAITFLTRK